MIDELDLEVVHAEAIIEKAIEFEVYTDDMPDSKKEKMEAAHEIVAFGIDSWTNDGMKPDAKDKGAKKAGKMIAEILEIAGVEIDEDDEVTYNDPPELEGDGDNDDDGDGDEAPFDVEDVIEGYEELTAATRLKKIKALELDPEDDDDYNTLVGIAEWEEAQEKPSSRVLDYLNDIIPPEEGDGDGEGEEDDAGDGEGDGEEGAEEEPWDKKSLNALDREELKEAAEEFEVEFPKRLTDAGKKKVVAAILEAQEEADNDGDGESEGGEDEEPWEGYDEASVKDIKEAMTEAQEDDDEPLTLEQAQYVLDYEEATQERKSLVKFLTEIVESFSEEPEEDEKPKRGKRGKSNDLDDSDDADNAVAKDDAKDKKSKVGKITITRDQILEALAEGEVTIG